MNAQVAGMLPTGLVRAAEKQVLKSPADERPERKCNGGPNGQMTNGWCGKPAEFIAGHRLQWFACAEHTEGAPTIPIDVWFEELRANMAAKMLGAK